LDETPQRWTRKDYMEVSAAVFFTLVFSIRTGEYPSAILKTLRYLLAYYVYGAVIVLLFIGLNRHMFKFRLNKKMMIKGVFYLAVLFAVTQMFHEAFLMLTGQR